MNKTIKRSLRSGRDDTWLHCVTLRKSSVNGIFYIADKRGKQMNILRLIRDSGDLWCLPFYDREDYAVLIGQLLCLIGCVVGVVIHTAWVAYTLVVLFTALWSLPHGLRFNDGIAASCSKDAIRICYCELLMLFVCLGAVMLIGGLISDVSRPVYVARITVMLAIAGIVFLHSPQVSE